MEFENLETPITSTKMAHELDIEIEDLEELLDELDIEPTEEDGDEYELTLDEMVLLKDEIEDWKDE